MIKLRKLSVWAGAIVALGFCAEARADFLVQVTSTAVTPAPPGITTVGSSSVTVTSFLDTASNLNTGPSNTPASATSQAFGVTSVASTSVTGDVFNIPINFQLVLSGIGNPGGDTGTTATINVKGTLAGSIGIGNDSLAFTNGPGSDLANPTANQATSTYTFVNVDGIQVGVALTAYTPPGNPPGTATDFAVYLFAPVPEPSTMALLGVGGLLLAAPKLRRRVRRLADSK